MTVQRSLVRSQIISTAVGSGSTSAMSNAMPGLNAFGANSISSGDASWPFDGTFIGVNWWAIDIGSCNVFAPAWRVATALSSPTEPDLLSTADYLELGEALSDLHNLSDDEHWKIEQPVYGASIQVAAALMEKNIPRPGIFTHGPKSVVFNWSSAERNLYLTITGSGMSVLVSSRDGIEYRAEIAGPRIEYTNYLFSTLSLSLLRSPENLS